VLSSNLTITVITSDYAVLGFTEFISPQACF